MDTWDSDIDERPNDLDWRFENSVDCSPVIQQLSDYLTHSLSRNPNNHSSALKVLILKQIQSRHWPHPYISDVAQLCRNANIMGVFLQHARNQGGEALETVVYNPSNPASWKREDLSVPDHAQYQYRYLYELRRKAFYARNCKTTPDLKIMRDYDWKLEWLWD